MKKSPTVVSVINRGLTVLLAIVVLAGFIGLGLFLSSMGINKSINSVKYGWSIRYYSVAEGASFASLSSSLYILISVVFIFCLTLVILHWYNICYDWPVKYLTKLVRLIILLAGFYLIGMGGYLTVKIYPELVKQEPIYKAQHENDRWEMGPFDYRLNKFTSLSIAHFAFGAFTVGIAYWTRSAKVKKQKI